MAERTSGPRPEALLPRTELELDILLALGERPRHGYGIIQDIERRSPTWGDLRSGTLYVALRRLKSDGLIEPSRPPADDTEPDARRKYVALTDLGRRVTRLELQRLRSRLRVGVERALLEPGP